MFLPLDQKPDWRNPPLVTLVLVIANVLIFYIWQYNDERYSKEAYEYYFYSGLVKTELKKYLEHKNTPDRLSEADLENATADAHEVFEEMRRDGEFLHLLEQNKIIKPDDPLYLDWRPKHNRFKRLQDRVIADKYGISPANPSALTLFTNMFLHGSSGHLIGNMVMLLLLGFGVEIIIGRLLFLIGYLFSGLTAGLLYVALFQGDAITGVGASGAIAGILGMSVMLYGLRKINFFYFLFVYFDYVKARAIWILPLYVLSQLIIEFVFNTNINVAAHLGGFLGGLVFIAVLKLVPNLINTAEFQSDQQQDALQNELSSVRQMIAAMQMDAAHQRLLELQKTHPDDQTINQLLFTTVKANPGSEAYHQHAHALLGLTGWDNATAKLIHETFSDYATRARPKPRWTPDMMVNIALRFAANGFLSDAETIMNHLIKARQDFPRNPEGLFALAKNYNGKDRDKAQHYRDLLIDLFPDSNEVKRLGKSAN